jgi:hypothetical protein
MLPGANSVNEGKVPQQRHKVNAIGQAKVGDGSAANTAIEGQVRFGR